MTEDLKHHDADLVDEAETDSPAAAAALGREVRFGLTLLGLLLAMLAVAVYVKMGTPGLLFGRGEVATADGDQEAPAEDTLHAAVGELQPPSADAMPVPAHEDTSAAKPLWENDQVAGRHDVVPPADMPLPVGNAEVAAAEEPRTGGQSNPFAVADQAAEPIDQVSAETEAVPEDAPPQEGPESLAPAFGAPPIAEQRGEMMSADNEPAEMLAEPELAADAPADGAPLLPGEAGDDRPNTLHEPGAIQPAAGQQPTLAEPRNSPYGRATPRDRYAQAPRDDMRGDPVDEGSRAAPSADHTPLHTIPGQRWTTPGGAAAADPYASPLERELQNARTPPQSGQQHAPPAAMTNDLDAPASEFAAPQEDISRHQHRPAHVPTPDGTYAVEPNDSFWTISQKVYGTGGYFKAVQRHNRKPGTNADGLEIGERILVPPIEELEQKYPRLCPKRRGAPPPGGRALPTSSHGGYGGRVYVVEEGDTLFDIARYELGKASRWAEIYDLNRNQLGSDYDYLAPGTKLMLPDEQTNQADNITARPGGQMPR